MADPLEGLARVARVEALELRVHREARADPEVGAPHLGVEAIERAHGRTAVDLALEVVHPAVAGADEAPGRLDEAHRAAEVHAPRRDRDVLAVAVGRALVDLRVALADIDGRLAGLADARAERDDLRDVVVVRELVDGADVVPGLLVLLEDRPQREAERREGDRRDGHRAGDVRRTAHEAAPRHRLAFEGARDPAIGRVLRLGLFAILGHFAALSLLLVESTGMAARSRRS